MKISDMNVGEPFEGYYLITKAELRQTRAGKDFLSLSFQDETGTIAGNLWDASPEQSEIFVSGVVVYMSGKKELYQGQPQVNHIQLRLAVDNEPNDPADYKEKPPVAASDLRDYLSQKISAIDNSIWQQVVRTLYQKYDTDFYTYPAAKANHHAFETGLAFHTATMVQVADKLADVYPQLNRGLLFAGIMLHDLAKVIELTGPDNTNYTLRGNLIGHITLIDEEVTKVLLELGIDDTLEDVLVLRHCLLSHHGQLDYGSPVRPMIMEAEIIHMIDNIDAHMMMMTTALSQVAPGERTSQIWALEKRSFYKPECTLEKEEVD